MIQYYCTWYDTILLYLTWYSTTVLDMIQYYCTWYDTILLCLIQCNYSIRYNYLIRYNTTAFDMMQLYLLWYSCLIQYHFIWYNTTMFIISLYLIQYHYIYYNTTVFDTIQYNCIWYDTTVWYNTTVFDAIQLFWLQYNWADEKILGWVAKTFYNDEANPKTDLTDPDIWWNTFFVQIEAGLMKVVRCLNRSCTRDGYFSLRRPTL